MFKHVKSDCLTCYLLQVGMCYEYVTPIVPFLEVSMRELLKFSIMESGERSAIQTGTLTPPL